MAGPFPSRRKSKHSLFYAFWRDIILAMSAKTVSEIEASIAQLDLSDQLRVLQFLTPKIAGAVLNARPSPPAADPWRQFQAVGAQLAATSLPGAASLTTAVSQMRR